MLFVAWIVSFAHKFRQTGLLVLISLATLRETYPVTVLEGKTRRLRKKTNNPSLISALSLGHDPYTIFKDAIIRPALLFRHSLALKLLSAYISIAFGTLYIFFSTVTGTFSSQYGFSPDQIGLAFVPIGLGQMIPLFIYKWAAAKLKKTNKTAGESGSFDPERRLIIMLVGACILPCGLVMYGWSVHYYLHCIVPMIAMFFISAAVFFINVRIPPAFSPSIYLDHHSLLSLLLLYH